MKKEEIYEILKNADLSDFEELSNEDNLFQYKKDKLLTISYIQNKDVYNYIDKKNLSKYDEFVKSICEIDNTKKYYPDIPIYTWIIKYNNITKFKTKSLHIGAGQTIDFEIPYNLEVYDFELNLIYLLNEYFGGTARIEALRIINNSIIKK